MKKPTAFTMRTSSWVDTMLSGRCGNCFDQLNIQLSAFALPWAANGDDGGTHMFVDQFEESIDVAGGVTA